MSAEPDPVISDSALSAPDGGGGPDAGLPLELGSVGAEAIAGFVHWADASGVPLSSRLADAAEKFDSVVESLRGCRPAELPGCLAEGAAEVCAVAVRPRHPGETPSDQAILVVHALLRTALSR